MQYQCEDALLTEIVSFAAIPEYSQCFFACHRTKFQWFWLRILHYCRKTQKIQRGISNLLFALVEQWLPRSIALHIF